MEDDVLENHRNYIVKQYRRGLPEETIAKDLDLIGVKTTHYDIYEALRRWNLIPSPSLVCSTDTIHSNAGRQQNPEDMLRVTCHHGDDSHGSQDSLSRIPSYPTSMQSYEEDVQLHEELAYDLQLQGNDTKDLLDERGFQRNTVRDIQLSQLEHLLISRGLKDPDKGVPRRNGQTRLYRIQRLRTRGSQQQAQSSKKELSNRRSDQVS